jgi:NADH-quinone oxidoreductase subunit E
MKINEKTVRDIINRNNNEKSNLLAILTDIQNEYNWLPPQALKIVADELGIHLIDVYGVASFYHAFSLSPRGKHVVTVCQGTACHVRGAPFILDRIKGQLGVDPGCTTKDEQFTLETVNCLGACALAPIVVVDGDYHGQATVQKADGLLAHYSKRTSRRKTSKTKKKQPRKAKKAAKRTPKKRKKATRKKATTSIKTKKRTRSVTTSTPKRKSATTKVKRASRKRTKKQIRRTRRK